MAQSPGQQQAPSRPQPNIYTLLLLIAIVMLVVTIALSLTHLMSESGYAMSFGELFEPLQGGGTAR
ncbi:MAG: hypothetical protein ACLFVW_02635 [Phycisphaerae bacterium]